MVVDCCAVTIIQEILETFIYYSIFRDTMCLTEEYNNILGGMLLQIILTIYISSTSFSSLIDILNIYPFFEHF